MEKLGYDNEEYKSFCLKLIRNLGHYSIGTNYFNPTFERCDILYIWLYHSLKSEDIPDNIIEKCFDDYKDQIKGMTSKYKCTYDSYKSMYLYPMKINILKLFDNNIEILRKILIGTHQSNKTLCRKFVCECVRLYKLMKDTYCHNGRERQENYTNTCTKLKEFEQSYSLLHFNKGLLNLNIPSLNNIDRDLIDKCPSDEGKIVLPLHEDRTLQPALGNRLNVDSGDPNNYLSDVATPVTVDNSMKKHITTSIGTVAGASSLLAFLYKVHTNFNLII
ncbi:hypothetical protein PVBG_05938 [Plasmodium vivax Brazil I]|uniref:Uncharacterized protein n=1 Tax=Plasmodium vivax (strain Brazil I) TaxID=1033975 RepID=A0A0J9SK71_PLAV1|nr:hypothetical protein PVBG_05937 [Plasmodium vivax Brazil I]KMZ83426.1 hypothetical protein PVBG_05938 [Plasmodium vivax Brazil I]